MGNLFLKNARRTDIKDFLKEASSESSIKYRAEKGATHLIYIPYQEVDTEEGTKKALYNITAKVHEWTASDGKFKSTICTKGQIFTDDQGRQITDGSCPFCDRIADSWNIYNYRYKEEELRCGKTGDELRKHMDTIKTQLAKERKTSKPKDAIYILVAQFKTTNGDNGVQPVMKNNLPAYDLKVMKLSAARVEKIQKQLANNGASIEGCELVFEYDKNEEDIRLLVGQCSIAPVFPNNMLTFKYPEVKAAIDVDVAKFDWDGLEKAFPEWEGMSSQVANNIVTGMFKQWDAYVEEAKINPNAKYGEYLAPDSGSNPSIDGAINAPQIGGITMPTMGQMGAMPTTAPTPEPAPTPQAGVTMPNMSAMPTMTMPTMGAMPNVGEAAPQADASGVFAGTPGIQL